MASPPGRLRVRRDDSPFRRIVLRHRRQDVVGRADVVVPDESIAEWAQPPTRTCERFDNVGGNHCLLPTAYCLLPTASYTGSISKLRSTAGAECVSAPTE